MTGGKLNSQSTIAALMENESVKAVVEQYLPGFADNQQAKAAYGMTFGKIGSMLGLPETALKALLDALDNRDRNRSESPLTGASASACVRLIFGRRS